MCGLPLSTAALVALLFYTGSHVEGLQFRPDADVVPYIDYAATQQRTQAVSEEDLSSAAAKSASPVILTSSSTHGGSTASTTSTGSSAAQQASTSVAATSTPSSSNSSASWSWSAYHTHDAMLAFLQRLAAGSGGRCRVEQLGKSVKGRAIVAVVVGNASETLNYTTTKAPTRKVLYSAVLPKPSFTWIGNMHGDETANRELLLRLAAGMCSGELAAVGGSGAGASGTGAGAGAGVGAEEAGRWSALLASTVVRIVPSMNPDGYSANPKTRYNANWVDLNRNFWDDSFPYAKPSPEEALAFEDEALYYLHNAAATWSMTGNFSLQPEGKAVAAYLSATRPELSANLHGGALVANYPLDACDSLGDVRNCTTQEEPLPRMLAEAYAAHNAPMLQNNGFPFDHGTVQGAVWYTVLGSMQDWTYHALRLLQLTLELHEDKEPPAASLPGLWGDNRGAMLRLMELSHMGLRAAVRDADTGRPLAANLTVVKPRGIRGAVADARGYLHKPMAPGVSYWFAVQPYDPAAPAVRYEGISFTASLSVGRAEMVYGTSFARLGVVRTFLGVKAVGTSG